MTAKSTSLYKYTSVSTLRHILNGSIRFTQPGAFNDPFELLPELIVPPDYNVKQINIQFDVKGARRPSIGDEIQVVPDGATTSDIVSRSILSELNSKLGIVCLCRNDKSLLMWSHYADQYTGAMVEFDGSHEFFEAPVPVEYSVQRPIRDITLYASPRQPIPVAELCTKSREWAYEDEVRVIRTLEDCENSGGSDPRGFPIFTKKIPLECIKSVTLGERTTIAHQRDIFGLIRETNIVLMLAAIDYRGYEFRIELIKYNVPVSQMPPIMTPRTAHIFSHLNTQLGEFARALIEKHPLSKIVNLTA